MNSDTSEQTKAKQIAVATAEFEKARTGHSPKSVSVVMCGETLVIITLHAALSPAEQALAATPAGSAQIQAYRRQLFDTSAAAFRQKIKDIAGVEVVETADEVEAATGTVVTVFTSGTVVQVYLLAEGVPNETHTEPAARPRGVPA